MEGLHTRKSFFHDIFGFVDKLLHVNLLLQSLAPADREEAITPFTPQATISIYFRQPSFRPFRLHSLQHYPPVVLVL